MNCQIPSPGKSRNTANLLSAEFTQIIFYIVSWQCTLYMGGPHRGKTLFSLKKKKEEETGSDCSGKRAEPCGLAGAIADRSPLQRFLRNFQGGHTHVHYCQGEYLLSPDAVQVYKIDHAHVSTELFNQWNRELGILTGK